MPRWAEAGPTREALCNQICQQCVCTLCSKHSGPICFSNVSGTDVKPGVYIVEGRGSNGEDVGLLLLTRIALSLGFIIAVGIFTTGNSPANFGEVYFHL